MCHRLKRHRENATTQTHEFNVTLPHAITKELEESHTDRVDKYTHPLQGACAEPKPRRMVALAMPKMRKLIPMKTCTSRMRTGPTETRVKKIPPTRSTPRLSRYLSITLGRGTKSRIRQKSGIGKKIHIMCPHVHAIMVGSNFSKMISAVGRIHFGRSQCVLVEARGGPGGERQ